MNKITETNDLLKSPSILKLSESNFPIFQKDFLQKRNESSEIKGMSQCEVSIKEEIEKSSINMIETKLGKIDLITDSCEKKIKNTMNSDDSPRGSFRKRQKKVKLEEEFIEIQKEKITLATNLPHEKLLEDHLNAKNSTVIPFLKKFIHKLRNSTSFRDISQLKEINFQILNDLTYYFKEEKLQGALTNSKGIRLICLKIRNLWVDLQLKIENSIIILFLMSFWNNQIKIFHPYQNFKIFWDILHLILIIFWLFYLPMLISFYEANHFSMTYLEFSLLFFFLDILITLNTAYFKSGTLEQSRSKIFSNYFRNYLTKDILALFPLILDFGVKRYMDSHAFNCLESFHVDESCSKIDTTENEELFTYLRKFNIIKLLIFIKLIDFKFIYSRILEKFLIQEKYQNIISLIKLAFISLLFAHIFGCCWHFIADVQLSKVNWLIMKGIENNPWLEQYLYSIYWSSVTIMTVGYGDIVPQNDYEIILAIITITFGCGVYAFNLNSIGMILQDINKEHRRFKHNINIINQFMQRKNVHPDLQMRVREYLRFIWKEEKAQNLEEETQIINVLSGNLREELLLEAYGGILKKYPLFYANFSEKALKKTVNYIKDCKYIPEEIIYDEKTADDPSIYFIMKGEVEIYTNKASVQKETGNTEEIFLKILKQGEFFGEISFFTGKPRLALAKSLDFTTLFSIKRSEFINILRSNESLIDDYDKFCMIRDQILLYENYNSLTIRCFSCNQLGHLSSKCSLIHYIPDYEKIIKTHNYQLDQERDPDFKRHLKNNYHALFSRRMNEHKLMTLRADLKKSEELIENNRSKNLKTFMKNLTGRMIFEEDSSLEEDDDNDENESEEDSCIDVEASKEGNDINETDHYDNDSNFLPETEDKAKIEYLGEINKMIKNPNYIKDGEDILVKNMNKSSKLELNERMERSSPSQNSLKLPGKSVFERGHRHSALAILGPSKEENMNAMYIKQRTENEENSKRNTNTKKSENSTGPFHSFQKSILRNPGGNNDVKIPSLNSMNKIKSSINTKLKLVESSILLDPFNKKVEETNKQNSSTTNLNPVILDEILQNINCFEKARNFKGYFPDNNISKIINFMDSQSVNNRKICLDKFQKQRKMTTRLSKYTFFSEQMKNKMPEVIMKRIRNSKGSKVVNNISDTPTSPNLFAWPNTELKKNDGNKSPYSSRFKKRTFFQDKANHNGFKFIDLADMLIKNLDVRKKLKGKKKILKILK